MKGERKMVNTSNLEEFKAKFEEVCKDEEFVKSLLALEEPSDVKAALEGKGLEMTEEEILKLRDVLVKTAEKGGEELSEDELESVAGGELCCCIVAGIFLAVTAVCTGASLVDTFYRRW